jgi:hypothetical protein
MSGQRSRSQGNHRRISNAVVGDPGTSVEKRLDDVAIAANEGAGHMIWPDKRETGLEPATTYLEGRRSTS